MTLLPNLANEMRPRYVRARTPSGQSPPAAGRTVKRAVTLLAIASVLAGFTSSATRLAGNFLFLSALGANALPWIYIGASVLALLSVYTLPTTSRAIKSKWGAVGLLGLSFIFLAAFSLVLRSAPSAAWIGALIFLWSFAQDILLGQVLSARIEEMVIPSPARTARTMELWGVLAGGVLAMFLGAMRWAEYLLPGAALGMAGLLALNILLTRMNAQRKSGETGEKAGFLPALPESLRTAYFALIAGLCIVAVLSLAFLEQLYQLEVGNYLYSMQSIAMVLGFAEAATVGLTLLAEKFLSKPLTDRYGLSAGLVSLPGVILAGMILLVIIILFAVTLARFSIPAVSTGQKAVLWVVVFMRILAGGLRIAIDRPAFRVLFQPLTDEDQPAGEAYSARIIEPITLGAAGLLLFLILLQPLSLFVALPLCTVLWIGLAIFQERAYKSALVKAVTSHKLDVKTVPLNDASSMSVIERGLLSPQPRTVIYSLDILEKARHPDLEAHLAELLEHPYPQVRLSVLERIERLNLVSLSKQVEKCVAREAVPKVKGRVVRTWAALCGTECLDQVLPYLEDKDPDIKIGAMVGLLRGGGIEGVLATGETLIDMTYASDPVQRQFAAQVLGEVNISNFYKPLLRLLQDRQTDVRREAIYAASRLKSPRLWPLVIDSLNVRGVESAARAALAEAGEEVLPLIQAGFEREDLSPLARASFIQVCGRIAGPRAIVLLKEQMEYPSSKVRYQALQALKNCSYHAEGSDVNRVEQALRVEIAQSAMTLASLQDLSGKDRSGQQGAEQEIQAFSLLRAALTGQFERQREEAMLLLSFIYDAKTVLDTWNTIHTNRYTIEERESAIKNLSLIIPPTLMEIVAPILQDIPPLARLVNLGIYFPQMTMLPNQRIHALLSFAEPHVSQWVKTCALWTMEQIDPLSFQRFVEEYQRNPTPQVEVILSSLQRSSRGGKTMLSLIEKVLLLKTVYVLSNTPDEVLAEVANLLEEVVVKEGETILHKGEAGGYLYILIDGEVRIHDEKRIFSVRGDGEVLGEMSLLDGEPVSASVTANRESTFLRMDQYSFYELMADRIEVAQGIIRMLTQRLRAMMEMEAVEDIPAQNEEETQPPSEMTLISL